MINLPNKEIIEKTINLNSNLTENIVKERNNKKNMLEKSLEHNGYEILIRLNYNLSLNCIVLKIKSTELFVN